MNTDVDGAFEASCGAPSCRTRTVWSQTAITSAGSDPGTGVVCGSNYFFVLAAPAYLALPMAAASAVSATAPCSGGGQFDLGRLWEDSDGGVSGSPVHRSGHSASCPDTGEATVPISAELCLSIWSVSSLFRAQ